MLDAHRNRAEPRILKYMTTVGQCGSCLGTTLLSITMSDKAQKSLVIVAAKARSPQICLKHTDMVEGEGYGEGSSGSEEENNIRGDNQGGSRKSRWHCQMC